MIHSREEIHSITFDVGGTLVHAYPSVGAVYAMVLRRHGVEASEEEIQDVFRQVFSELRQGPREVVTDESEKRFWRDLVESILGDRIPEDRFDRFFEDLYDAFGATKHWRLEEDAVDTIEDLKTRGYEVSILSNADSRLRDILEAMGVAQRMKKVFISAEVGLEKPDRRLFRHVEESLQREPAEMLHIGDSYFHDIEGADRARWNSLHLSDRSDRREGRIESLSEVLDLLP